jgi:hypothetical protein
MAFCEHCQGQRFDRARVLRALRRVQSELRESRAGGRAEGALRSAVEAIRALDIPHLEVDEPDDQVVH